MPSAKLTITVFLAAIWCWTAKGEFYTDVACPGVNSELKCPEGQEITVFSMEYGAKSSVDCSARDQPAMYPKWKCIHWSMLGWVQSICDGMQRCRLPKPHPDMLTCDRSEENFIQISYMCYTKSPDRRKVVFCENQRATLKCDRGRRLMITSTKFGRFDENTCTKGRPSKMTFCSSPDNGYIKKRCEGMGSCSFVPNARTLGKPSYCDHLPKYALVEYLCL
ncbi:L-rhamnose-binding lectin SML-like [Plectropomus leopardus]|uniref:L-rhamnose-binding lectin SML-like n=1 Tax=Plectropomus leopardus TaxID=160734 RepID=UPI001C4DC2B9|nr:L-rhamnose-binding lectin SML-like [Plectropomus leopardus]